MHKKGGAGNFDHAIEGCPATQVRKLRQEFDFNVEFPKETRDRHALPEGGTTPPKLQPPIWHTVDAIWHTAMLTGRRTRHPINLMLWGTPPWRMQILLGRAKQVQNEAGGTYRNGQGRVSDQEDPFRSVWFIA